MTGDFRVLLIALLYNIVIFILAFITFLFFRHFRGDSLYKGVPLFPLLTASASLPALCCGTEGPLADSGRAGCPTPLPQTDYTTQTDTDSFRLILDGTKRRGPFERSLSFTTADEFARTPDTRGSVGVARITKEYMNWDTRAHRWSTTEGLTASLLPVCRGLSCETVAHRNFPRYMVEPLYYGPSSTVHRGHGPDTVDDHLPYAYTDTFASLHTCSFLSWVREYLSIKDERFTSRFVQLYLLSLRTVQRIACTLSVISLAVVLPVNLLTTNLKDHGDWLDRAAAGNVDPYHWRVWFLWICTWVYSGIAYYYIYNFWMTVRSSSSHLHAIHCARQKTFRPEALTVMVKELPKTLTAPEILFDHFERLFPNCVVHVSIPLNLSDFVRVFKNLRWNPNESVVKAVPQLSSEGYRCSQSATVFDDGTQNQSRNTGLRKTLWHSGLPSVESSGSHRFLNSYSIPLNGALPIATEDLRLPPGVGIGFVSFRNPRCVARCLRDPRVAGGNHDWRLTLAPPPEDILWEYIHVSDRRSALRSGMLNFMLLLVSIFLTSSAVLTNALIPLAENVEKAVTESSFFKLSITGWGSPLILLLINSVCLPQLVHWKSHLAHFWRKSKLDLSILHGNVVFLVLNSVIFPALGNGSIGAFLSILYHTELQQWNITLGRLVIGQSGSFALRYLLNASFLSSSVQLLQFTPQWLYANTQLDMSGTSATHDVEEPRRPFDFGYSYAFILAIFFMMLTFGLVVPLLIPLATLFCVMKYHVDKYNFLYGVWSVKREGGTDIAMIVVRYMLAAVAFFQFVMSGYFIAIASSANTNNSGPVPYDVRIPVVSPTEPLSPVGLTAMLWNFSASRALVLAGTFLFLASLTSAILLTGDYFTTFLSEETLYVNDPLLQTGIVEDDVAEHLEQIVSPGSCRDSKALTPLQEDELITSYEQPYQAEVKRYAAAHARRAVGVFQP